MSREIKFRLWVNDHWTDWLPTSKSLGAYNAVIVDEDDYSTDSECCIEQYTGLKDKNGKEIYEGDIVIIGKEYALILYDKSKASFMGCFYVDYKGMTVKQNDFIFDFCPNYIKVIGNIHENPELLGGEE